MSDPLLLFVLLVESCMPSAQVRRQAGRAAVDGVLCVIFVLVSASALSRSPELPPCSPSTRPFRDQPPPPLCPPQNLIILLQVSERTQALAPSFARMLLKLYAYACIPVTIWVSAFATNLGLHLR